VIAIEDLTIEIGARRVVDGISLSIAPSQTLGLVGESGSGKTMTALSILRLVAPPISIAGGDVWYQGQNLMRLHDEALRGLRGRQIAMIFQNPRDRFDPLQTIGEQLVEVLLHHRVAHTGREAERSAMALLAEVQLPDAGRVMRLYPNEVSGGMLQRAMIALAIAPAPDLLIADEPTSALDVTIQSEILDLLKELEESRNMSILFITHDISVARQVADTVAVMYAGQVVEYGAAAEVFANPRHPYTQALLASVPSPDAEVLHPIPGQPAALSNPPPGCRFAPRCPSASEHGRAHEPPPTVEVGGVAVRCWLYETARI
jgi:oligopeptide/dipeptide ABC transporter ATP-binding protein